MFSNYRMVETIGALLDPDVWEKKTWDAAQWKAYCRVVLMTFRDYVEKDSGGHSFVLYRAKGYIEHAAFDLYKLDGVATSGLDDDVRARLAVVVDFIKDAIEVLDKKGLPDYVRLRIRGQRPRLESFYDHLASMIFEVILAASSVKSPRNVCWWIQHNSVWMELFGFRRLEGPAGKIVTFKVRRLLYDAILEMNEFPNFKGAAILGYCLNVMGLTLRAGDHYRDSKALHKAVLSWTKRRFAWLRAYNSRIAEACLVDGLSYDEQNRRLVKTYPAGLSREPSYDYLAVDVAPTQDSSGNV